MMSRVVGQSLLAGALAGLAASAPCAAGEPPSSMSPDFWGVMPDDRPSHALPGDRERWTDGCDAAPEAHRPLGLTDAVRLALCSNPQSRSAWLAYLAQAATVGQSRASLLPTVNAGLSSAYQRTLADRPLGLDPSDSVVKADGGSISLNWTLFDFGARASLRREAERGSDAARASHEAVLQQVAVTAAQAWHDAAAQQASAALAGEAEEAAKVLLAATEARVVAGALIPLDALQARTALSQATLARVRAAGQERTAKAALARAVHLPVGAAIVLEQLPAADLPTEQIEQAVGRELQEIDQLWDGLLARHPSVVAAESQLQAARARADASLAEGLPSVALAMSQYVNGRPSASLSSTHTDERTVSVNVSFPLFEGFERVYRIKGQLAQLQSREADLEAARAQVAFEAWRSREQLSVSVAAVRASADVVRSANAALDLATWRQQAGSGDVTEVASARRDFIAARLERVQSLAAWRISRLRLIAALGRLGLENLGER